MQPQTRWCELRRWVYGKASHGLFSFLFYSSYLFIIEVMLRASLAWCKTLLSTADRVALWPGQLLNRQLACRRWKGWNSEGMLAMRRSAWNPETEVPNPDTIAGVLEFLEKVSSLEKDGYITRQLVWDTCGWYVGRYFFHGKEEIERLRTKWIHSYDPTLYQDLDGFYGRLLAFARQQRKWKAPEIEEEYQRRRKMFILSEAG